jgi:monomeric isocitrate dehydrogenase
LLVGDCTKPALADQPQNTSNNSLKKVTCDGIVWVNTWQWPHALNNWWMLPVTKKAALLGDCLNKAVGRILTNCKGPSRTVNQINNRTTNYYVALYWADFLQQEDPEKYKKVFEELSKNRSQIVEEFKQSQGKPVDLGGYYLFDADKAKDAMNPSPMLNKIHSSFGPAIL